MNHDYPHLADTKFPDLATTDVYKYENNFDYDRYKDTVKIKMLNVSWCGDYDNAVYFETKELRDQWFDNEKGLVKELPTMFRLYSDGNIKVDLPIDECMDYNYVMIDYGKLPQQDKASDNSRMFYFINDCIQSSPNATTLMLSVDYWTTFINDMDISYVNLVRGHAPMAETSASEYLSNPIDNSEYLLTVDVNFGQIQRAVHNDNVIFNDDKMLLGFHTNANMILPWTNRIPTVAYSFTQSFSAVDVFVLDIEEWHNFRTVVMEECPQFFTTVKGMFIIPEKLIRKTTAFTFCGFNCHHIESNGDKKIADYVINKSKFHYPSNIANIAKLYTFPYAAIEVNDMKGNTTIIKVEDTVGSLELHTITCHMYPFMHVEAYMLGLGGDITSTITFKTADDNTFKIGGRYYDFNTKWHIPIMAVQLTVEKNWELNNEIGATASKESAYLNASVAEANAALRVATNSANTTAANTAIYDHAVASTRLALNNAAISNSVIGATANSEIDAANMQASISANTMTTTAQNSANASMINSTINGISGIATGAMSGASAGPVGVGLGAASGLLNGITGFATSAVSADMAVTNANTQASAVIAGTNVANGLKSTQASIHQTENTNRMQAGATATEENGDVDVTYNNTLNSNNNALTTASTTNSASATRANADRSYNAAYNQTMLNNPPMFGQMTGTPELLSKPFGLSYNVVTQSKNAIRQAAEQFLRYGYMLNMQWNVGSYNLMPKFTYWQCDVVYCNDNGVYEGAQNMIKEILNKGVTVWKNPNEIGLVSIYQNI